MNLAWPFAVQGLLLFADEVFCHRRRRLRRWERVGHAMDTLFFILPLLFANLIEPGPGTVKAFIALAVFSCLVVSKDEWEHVELCSGFEHWLHALLFMMHSALLIWVGYLWWNRLGAVALQIGLAGSSLFFVYLLFYWNVWRRDRQ